MTCEETRPLLHAFLDDELDLVRSLEVERHLQGCAVCAREHAEQRALREALRDTSLVYRPPQHLEGRLRAALRAATATAGSEPGFVRVPERPRRAGWNWSPAWVAAALVVVSALTLWKILPWMPGSSAEDRLGQEVVANHVRSLMAGHLTDVPSSDQHTVKPWFNGRLDFSPPVKDLSTEGFPLVGGRLDYLAGRPVAALVYGRRRHVINLLVWPMPREPDRSAAATTRQGYHLFHWTQGGMVYWTVSDLNEDEMRQFIALLQR